MCEVVVEEDPIQSCLALLEGKEHEKKIAGLLMAAKYLKPTVFAFNRFLICYRMNQQRIQRNGFNRVWILIDYDH